MAWCHFPDYPERRVLLIILLQMRIVRLAGAQPLADAWVGSWDLNPGPASSTGPPQACHYTSPFLSGRLFWRIFSPRSAFPLLSAVPAFPGHAFILQGAAVYRVSPPLYTRFYCIFSPACLKKKLFCLICSHKDSLRELSLFPLYRWGSLRC